MRFTKTKALWALGALNAVLLCGMVFRGTSTATAQVGARNVPGEYIMVPGDIVGGNGAIIYILDTKSRKLTGRGYDANTKKFADLPPIDLDRVFQMGVGGGAAGAGGAGRRP